MPAQCHTLIASRNTGAEQSIFCYCGIAESLLSKRPKQDIKESHRQFINKQMIHQLQLQAFAWIIYKNRGYAACMLMYRTHLHIKSIHRCWCGSLVSHKEKKSRGRLSSSSVQIKITKKEAQRLQPHSWNWSLWSNRTGYWL